MFVSLIILFQQKNISFPYARAMVHRRAHAKRGRNSTPDATSVSFALPHPQGDSSGPERPPHGEEAQPPDDDREFQTNCFFFKLNYVFGVCILTLKNYNTSTKTIKV